MKTAVIVTTYNRPDALAAVLDGYQAQSTQGFELLVAFLQAYVFAILTSIYLHDAVHLH